MNGVHFTSKEQTWGTPLRFFALVCRFMRCELDVCAEEWNAKCPRFFTVREDGLSADWGKSVCWMNPPYKEVERWMKKAFEAALRGATVLALVPARTDTRWFQNWASKGQIIFIPGRLKFERPDGAKHSAPFPSVLILFSPATLKFGALARALAQECIQTHQRARKTSIQRAPRGLPAEGQPEFDWFENGESL